MHKVLLVDDEQNILAGYRRNLRSKFQIYVADSGAGGLKMIKDNGPFSVVVSDFKMPQMNGVEFLGKVKEVAPDTVRMMLTGYADLESIMQAVNEGNIFRFLTKPSSVEILSKNIYDAIGQYQLIQSEKQLLNNTLKGSVKILIEILSAVNPSAFSQATKCRALAKAILERLGKRMTWDIEIAALLSPIGLVTVPNQILEKRNNGLPLTEEESKIFFAHPDFAESLLKNIPRLEKVAEGIAYQFVNYNGEGGTKDFKIGENIPYVGKLLKVINDYFELQATGLEASKILEKMQHQSEKYDPDFLGALAAELEGYDKGRTISMVNLVDLKPGMILADGVKDLAGFLLLPKGSEVTEVAIMKLNNYSRMAPLDEPFRIISK